MTHEDAVALIAVLKTVNFHLNLIGITLAFIAGMLLVRGK
jgi:hypothetical protein